MNYKRENTIADLVRSEGIKKTFSVECRTDSIVRHPELVEKWVDIGLCAVLLGLEGGCDKTLKDVNKSCNIDTNNQAIKILQDNGVIIWGAFLVDPDWTEDDFKLLRDYVSENEITHTQFTILTPSQNSATVQPIYAPLVVYLNFVPAFLQAGQKERAITLAQSAVQLTKKGRIEHRIHALLNLGEVWEKGFDDPIESVRACLLRIKELQDRSGRGHIPCINGCLGCRR